MCCLVLGQVVLQWVHLCFFFFSLLKTAAGCSWKQSGWGSESEPNRKEVENQNKSKDAIKLQLRDTSLWVCHLKWPLHTSPPAAEPQKRSSEWSWCWTFFWASRRVCFLTIFAKNSCLLHDPKCKFVDRLSKTISLKRILVELDPKSFGFVWKHYCSLRFRSRSGSAVWERN